MLQKDESSLTIYSSPTARTLSTSAAITSVLGGETSITPAYALNCCAAAQSHGVAKAFPKEQPNGDVMREATLACWPPLGNAKQVDERQRCGGGFVESVKELASNHRDGDVLVMVTHREGIWQLQRHAGMRVNRSSYCSTSFFTYDLTSHALAGCDVSSPSANAAAAAPARPSFHLSAPRANATRRGDKGGQATPPPPPPGRHGASPPPRPDKRPGAMPSPSPARQLSATPGPKSDALQALLASGAGQAIVHRGGRSGSGTLLWKTPGVRGQWTDGGAIPDGEAVELLSPPVASEGVEGDFVLVRRATGIEGWTKVKNIQLPAV